MRVSSSQFGSSEQSVDSFDSLEEDSIENEEYFGDTSSGSFGSTSEKDYEMEKIQKMTSICIILLLCSFFSF